MIARPQGEAAPPSRVYQGLGSVITLSLSFSGADSEALAGRLRAAPEVPAAAHVDGPNVESSVRRSLARAGFDVTLLDF